MEEKLKPVIHATLHKFTVDFLDCPVTISIGRTVRDGIMKVDPAFIEDDVEATRGMTITGDDTGMCFIVLAEDSTVNTIVHECTHAVVYVLDYYSIAVSHEENEVMAYMMGYFVDCCYDAIQAHEEEKLRQSAESIKETKKSKKIKNT